MRVRARILPKPTVRFRFLAAVVAGVVALGTIAGVAPQAVAASAQQPVNDTSAADPGVTLYQNNFYAFTTGPFGLWEARASAAGGAWAKPRDVLNTSAAIPNWIDTSQDVWAPSMVQIPTSGEFAVYFAATLNPKANSGTTETPVAGTHCVGVALSSSPMGPFTIQPRAITCVEGYGAYDDMLANPGTRPTGNGVIDPDAVFINNKWDHDTNELFLLEKTTSGSGDATIRMVQLDMSTNGTSTLGNSSQILSAVPTGTNGGFVFPDTVEAPSLLPLSDGTFLLFVAHGDYSTCNYSTEYFKSTNPLSFSNTDGTTIQDQGGDGLCGPAGGSWSAAQAAGQYDWFFHAYGSGSPGSTREMYADSLTIGSGDVPSLTPIAPVTAELPGAPALYDPVSKNFDVYATGTDGSLEEDYWNGSSWSGLLSIHGSSITGRPSALYDPISNTLEVYATGTDGSVDEFYWNGSEWNTTSLGGQVTGSPTALYDDLSNAIEIYATSTQGVLEEDFWTRAKGWSGWTSRSDPTTGPTLASSPAAVNDVSTGNTEVFATDTQGNLEVDSWNPNSGWSGLTSLGGPVQGVPSPLYDTDTGNLETYVTGANGDLQEDALTVNGWAGLRTLNGSIQGNPSAVNDTASTNTEVYATGSPDDDLQEDAWIPGSGWNGLRSEGGSLAPSPAAVYDSLSGNMEVYAAGTNGQLTELYWNGSSWSAPTNIGGTNTTETISAP